MTTSTGPPPLTRLLPVLLQDLADDLSSELSGNFRSVVLGLLMLPPVYDAYELKFAMKVRGLGSYNCLNPLRGQWAIMNSSLKRFLLAHHPGPDFFFLCADV